MIHIEELPNNGGIRVYTRSHSTIANDVTVETAEHARLWCNALIAKKWRFAPGHRDRLIALLRAAVTIKPGEE